MELPKGNEIGPCCSYVNKFGYMLETLQKLFSTRFNTKRKQ